MLMVMAEILSGKNKLVLVGELPHFSPAMLFDYWTKPGLVCLWWPQEAVIEPRPGGLYHFSWPQMNWHLRGYYTSFEPGNRLAFTWAWDHEPENTSGTSVTVTFVSLTDGGTKMTIIHEPYTASEESQERRTSHLEGWNYFVSRLQDLSC